MNRVTISLYANIRDAVGARQVEYELEETTRVGDLRRLLAEKYPSLGEALKRALIAVNTEYAFDDELIPPGAELAIFPPVSGGVGIEMPQIIEITYDELDLEGLLRRITLENSGAACIFAGMVRAVTAGSEPHETEYLEYEAYKPMAEKKMAQIAAEIRQRWPDVQGIGIVQRIGRLFPCTPSVYIACSAAHRDTGVFEAAHYGIDRLKEIVPVWKKEVGPDGEQWVEGDYQPGPND